MVDVLDKHREKLYNWYMKLKFNLPSLSKWRESIEKAGYELGYKHGFEDGQEDKHKEIVNMLSFKLDTIDWLREDPIQIREVVPMVKKYKTIKEDVWE